jgi:hypothetical protein
LAASFIAGILPPLAMEPVTSSASATRIRVFPHMVVEFTLMSMFGKPTTFMKSVAIRPLADISIFDPLPVLAV